MQSIATSNVQNLAKPNHLTRLDIMGHSFVWEASGSGGVKVYVPSLYQLTFNVQNLILQDWILGHSFVWEASADETSFRVSANIAS